MPIGVIVNASAVILGGFIGSVVLRKIDTHFMDSIILVLGICAMSIGINSIVILDSMIAVVLAILIGTVIGEWLSLDKKIRLLLEKYIVRNLKLEFDDTTKQDKLVTITVLLCASGTGIYGALLSGMTGDHSILFAKSILDFFTTIIFAASLSYVVMILGVFQFVLMGLVFLSARLIMPFISPLMIADFVACGGIIMLATGLKISNIKHVALANMIPSLILVMPLSYFINR